MLLDNHLGPINHWLMKDRPAKRLQHEPAQHLREQEGKTFCRHVAFEGPHKSLTRCTVE